MKGYSRNLGEGMSRLGEKSGYLSWIPKLFATPQNLLPPAAYFSCLATRKVGKRRAPLNRRVGSGRGILPSVARADSAPALVSSPRLMPAVGPAPAPRISIRPHLHPRSSPCPTEGPNPLGGGTGLGARVSHTAALIRRAVMILCFLALGLILGQTPSWGETPTQGQIVRRVRIEGAHRMSEGRVLEWLLTRQGSALNTRVLERDLERILDGYREAGYWQVSLHRPEVKLSGGRASVVFAIREGQPTRIESVELTGNHQLTRDALMEVMHSRPGVRLLPDRLEADLEAVLDLYENQGYPYCALRPEVVIRPGSDVSQVRVEIDEGPLVRIDTVLFAGNRATKADVLARETRLQTGEIYDQRRVDRAVQTLRRLPYLLEVKPPRLDRVSLPGRTALVVDVRERSAGRVEGGLGYAPGPPGASRGLTGQFSLDFESFLGTGRGVHASWGRRGPESSDLELRYREPWAFGTPLSGEFHVSVRERVGFVENELGGAAAFAVTPDLNLRIGLRREGVRPGQGDLEGVIGSQFWGVEAGVRYDTRDDLWNPKGGSRYEGTLNWGRVETGEVRRSRRQFAVLLAHFVPTGGRSVAAVSLRAEGVMQSGRVPPEARLRLGGSATIRGHREEAFLATQASWMNLEWRLLLGRRSRAFLFADLGALKESGTDRGGAWLLPVGYGAGLRLESRMGQIGLDYGLAKGESPGQGKVHLRVANEF